MTNICDVFLHFYSFNKLRSRLFVENENQGCKLSLPSSVGFWLPASAPAVEKPRFRWTWGHRWREL